MDSNTIFDQAIARGISERFPEGMPEGYKERLDYEVNIIKSMGYVDYHLVVKDFLEYGRLLGYVPKDKMAEAPLTIKDLEEYIKVNGWENGGMRIGPGRGSAVGSLACYLLGITALDPIKYNLLFERFLNPERISMPDIDSDMSATTRGKVIEYVKNKYGEGAVCGIMTLTTQAPKGAVQMCAKFYGLRTYKEPMTSLGATISKDIPAAPGTSFATKIDKESGKIDAESDLTLYDYLLNKYASNKDAVEIIKWAKIMEGSFTAYGSHAAGIVISDNDDVSEYLPLRYNKRAGMFTTQCDMVEVEDNGLLKFDFLGLKTLDIITETLFMVEKNHGIIIDPLKIDLADANVYKNILSKGITNAVFQFESSGMKAMLKRFSPQSFEDLIILVSMFRPGPLQYLDGVIDVKNGVKPITYLTPELEPILGKTYGAIVYQEQVMQICQSLAGFTLGHADQVRRYMSKKKADKLAHERDAFVTGCETNGISAEIANTLFDQMMDFASYAFNKSHAAAYAFNAYITAWLKYYYPAEFFASALNWATPKKVPGLMYEAKSAGIKVLAPNINTSYKEYSATSDSISVGLSSIAGVKTVADSIIKERENGAFTSVSDFIYRVNPNTTVMNNLILAGAFDSFSDSRLGILKASTELKEIIAELKKKESFVASAEYVLTSVERLSAEELIKMQLENGYKAEIKEPTTVDRLNKRIENAKSAIDKLKKDISLVSIANISEDKTARLNKEKELLGMYVTDHPVNYYPNAEDIDCEVIDSISDGEDSIYGVITNLQIKKRKSDGKEMAFFQLEDKSGSIEVAMFTASYAKNKALINEGAVIKLSGKCETEEVEIEDEIITNKKYYADKAEALTPKKPALFISVPSYEEFKASYEDAFTSKYRDDNGYALYVYNKETGKAIKADYKVSESVKSLPGTKEMFI